MEDDKVANMEVNKVADREEDKVADMEVEKVAKMVADKEVGQGGWHVGRHLRELVTGVG